MSSSNSVGNFSLDTVNLRKNLTFPDGSLQTTSANNLLFYPGINNYGFGNLGNITSGANFTIYTFTGLVPNYNYIINGYCVIQSTGTINNLNLRSRVTSTGGGGFSYSKLYTTTFASGDIYYISFNDFVSANASGSVTVAINATFSGGTIAITSGQIRPLRIQI